MKKPVLILESRDFIVESKTLEKDGTYTLEGIFAEFNGEKNNNGRIYEASEYIPHLTYLNKKINENRLFGELDHPDKFDVSLSKVSHMITKLTYIKESNVIKGSVKLFNTRIGQDAQAILAGGGTLSISSRAAGIVNENTSKVQIKKIFTYDLVGDPGFSSAKLTRINESLNINDPNIGVYEVSDSFINDVSDPEVKQALNEMMIELNGEGYAPLNENLQTEEKLNKQNNIIMNDKKGTEKFVDVNSMSKYSKLIKNKMNEMNSTIKDLEANVKSNPNVNEIQKNVKDVVKFANYMAEEFNQQESKLDKVIGYLNYLGKNQNTIIEYTNHLSRNMGDDIDSVKKIQESQIDYMNYLGNKQNEAINYTEYMVEGLQTLKEFSNYLAENQNKQIEFGNYQAKLFEDSIQFMNYLSTNLNESINHGDYMAVMLDKGLQHTDYIGEKLNTAIEYTQYIAKNALPSLPAKQINENNNTGDITLDNRIASFLESVDKRKTVTKVEENIKGLLNEQNAYNFERLNEAEKQKVTNAILENKCSSEEEVMKVWENALITPEKQRQQRLLQNMPNNVRKVWDTLNESQKDAVLNYSKRWDLSNTAKIKDFWFRQNLTNESVDNIQEIANKIQKSEMYNSINESNARNRFALGYDKSRMMASLGINPSN